MRAEKGEGRVKARPFPDVIIVYGSLFKGMDKMESWENISRSEIYVKKLDHNGKEKSERVRPGGRLVISEQERVVLNQERCLAIEHDPFSNGFFQRTGSMTIASSAEDLEEKTAEPVDNPNHMSMSDLKDLFKLHWQKFDEAVSKISSVPLLERMVALVKDEDSGLNPTVRQANIVEARLEVARGTNVSIEEISQVGRLAGGIDDERSGLKTARVEIK